MFTRKYVFETRKTKTLRYLKNSSLFLVFFFFIYLICGYFFIVISENENKKTLENFFRSSPDAIVVFTGHKGRIPKAFKMAKNFKQSNIFITGVHSRNNVETFLAPLKDESEFNPDLIEIDYLARNTVENSLATLRYLRAHKEMKNILIISHDYHIPRIKNILGTVRTNDDHYNFFYSSVKTDYTNFKNIKILYTEVYKYIRTSFFLMIWSSDSDSVATPV